MFGRVVYGIKRLGCLFHLDVVAGEYACSGANHAGPVEEISDSSEA